MNGLVLITLTCLVISVTQAIAEESDSSSAEHSNGKNPEIINLDDEAEKAENTPVEEVKSVNEAEREGRLLAQYTTKTKAMFVTTTISALSTCFSATDTACKRRRKRNALKTPLNVIDNGK